jgi:hypothetical protein
MSSRVSSYGSPDIRYILDIMSGTYLGPNGPIRVAMILQGDYLGGSRTMPFFMSSYQGYLNFREQRLKKLELKV